MDSKVNKFSGKEWPKFCNVARCFSACHSAISYWHGSARSSFNVRISQQRLRLAKQRTVATVKNLYLSMLALQSSISSLERNLEFLKELERYVQAEVKRGAVLAVDDFVLELGSPALILRSKRRETI